MEGYYHTLLVGCGGLEKGLFSLADVQVWLYSWLVGKLKSIFLWGTAKLLIFI
jgi:hypothetical protein